ncbi:OmpA family protein [Desulfovibrio sp. OttesenSCG-928-I05]|nr:OmpA family protein [Desulfovibrio sp. OttesenSCG-928-I05]
MKRFKLVALIAAMVMAMATVAVAAPAGTMVPKVASFDFLVDYSGSMMMKNNSGNLTADKLTKMEIAKAALTRVNDKIPALNYSGSMHTFAPVAKVLDLAPYNKGNMDAAIKSLKSNLGIFNRLTPMGDDLSVLNPTYNAMARKAAVIMVTDGAANRGLNPVDQVNALYAANPDICVHVISLADEPKGKEVIQQIAALRKCSVVAEASDLVSLDSAVDKFVRDVFYDVVEGGVIGLRSVQFAFDSAAIDGPSSAILDEAAQILKANPGRVMISGHTCNIGNAAYNMQLSIRRANAVKEYLVKKGVPASMLSTEGFGLTRPQFDNRTEEGRRLNRRAEATYLP